MRALRAKHVIRLFEAALPERFAQLAQRLYRRAEAMTCWVRPCGGREHGVGVLEPGVALQRGPIRLDVKWLFRRELLVDLPQHAARSAMLIVAEYFYRRV